MKKILSLMLISLTAVLSAAGNNDTPAENSRVVNVYTHRHYDTDKELFALFTEKTGIQVNVVKAKADQLIERLNNEGENTPADVLITVDAGRLYKAKSMDLLQSVESEKLSALPARYRDSENHWFGLTKRARIIAYNKETVDPSELSTIEALTEEQWNGRVVIRSSTNIYNQSLMAAMIASEGKDAAKAWAEGMVNNMAREPKGNDRDQMKAVAAGIADVAVVNTYYLGKLLTSSKPEEVEVGKKMGIFFPNQSDRGTHINVSGAGVTKHAKNRENAILFIEFLASIEAQEKFASGNYEYPVHPDAEISSMVKAWGEFNEENVDLTLLGANNTEAVKVFDEAGWK